jgi:hypothetical protein
MGKTMHQRRDLIILVVLFGALIIFTILGPARSQDASLAPTPTTHSSAGGGALALLRWFDAMGYDAGQLQYRAFAIGAETDLFLMLGPSTPINRTRASIVLDWVERGGTLLLTANTTGILAGGNPVLQELGIRVERHNSILAIERAPVLQPVLRSPPLSDVLVKTSHILATGRDDVVPLVGIPPPEADEQPGEQTGEQTGGQTEQTEGQPEEQTGGQAGELLETETIRETSAVLFGVEHGEGYIYVSSATHPFTNAGLRDANNVALVLNVLRHVPTGGRILFDEYHHGYFTPPSLRSLLFGTAWGQAILYVLAVLALYFLATGRRFGRPVPLREETTRRSSAEYVESMADLFRRSRKRGFILDHYGTMFKRRLARPYGINPHLEDEQFVMEMEAYLATDRGSFDRPRLLALLRRLSHRKVSEQELLRAVLDMDKESETMGH